MNTRNQLAIHTSTELEEWEDCGVPSGSTKPWNLETREKGSGIRYYRHIKTLQVIAAMEHGREIIFEEIVPSGYGEVPDNETLPEQKETTQWKIAKALRHELLASDPEISGLVKFFSTVGITLGIILALTTKAEFNGMTQYNVTLQAARLLYYLTILTVFYLLYRLINTRKKRKSERRSKRYENLANDIIRKGEIPTKIGEQPISHKTRKKIKKLIKGSKE